jgi:hypothetical protein
LIKAKYLIKVLSAKNVQMPKCFFVGKSVKFQTKKNGRMIIGNNCWIGDYSKLITHDNGVIEEGENCFIGHFTILYGYGGLKI